MINMENLCCSLLKTVFVSEQERERVLQKGAASMARWPVLVEQSIRRVQRQAFGRTRWCCRLGVTQDQHRRFTGTVNFKHGGPWLQAGPAILFVHREQLVEHILLSGGETQTEIGDELGVHKLFGCPGTGTTKTGLPSTNASETAE